MATEGFDPVQYKAAQRRDWGLVAAGWKKWWPAIERGAQPVSERLVDLAGLRSGQRVLDVATGIGEPAVTAAQRVGRGGRVTATDQSPEMLALASVRAAELSLDNIEFREGDAETMDFPADSFDAVLSRWGLMFLPDLPRTLSRLYRVLRPGGSLSAAVWAAPPRVPLISLAMGVVRRELNLAPPQADMPGPFRLADVSILERALTDTGFENVRTERMTLVFEWRSAEEYVQFQQEIAAPITALLAAESAERRAAVWREVTEAARAHAGADGTVRLSNEAVVVAAGRGGEH